MAWEEEVEEEHEEEMEASEEEEEDVVVGQMPTFMVPKHINKRALKNKALSRLPRQESPQVRDFVTGFHKRKKKRRREANKITEEKERRKRIEARKKRKQEKEIALYGKVLSSDNADGEDGDEMDDDLPAPAPEIKTYEDGGTRITVVTNEITHDDDDLGLKPASTSYAKKIPVAASAKKNPSLGVKKQKPPPKRQYKKNKSKTKKVDTSRRKNKGKN
uniref:Uncharacterized protein n=1 Tax=Avena sativa TaxID=4498 RepID=A0ACD5XQ53_AVESA